MNGWDLFTWIAASGLFLGVVVIFIGFLRDVRGVLDHAHGEEE